MWVLIFLSNKHLPVGVFNQIRLGFFPGHASGLNYEDDL